MIANLADHIAEIACCLLGEPNSRFSTRQQLRFGNNGAIAVEIAGTKRGQWYDHEHGMGGGPCEMLRMLGNLADAEIPQWFERHLGARSSYSQYIVATYDYVDEQGALLFQVCRFSPKKFRQRKPNGNGGWDWKLGAIRKVPYRLPDLIAAASKQNEHPSRVYVCEGEKDCERLAEWGLTATTNAGGAGKWPAEFARYFVGLDVGILGDNDDAGRAHVAMIATSLVPVAACVRIPKLQGLLEKGDISDWIAAGGTQSDLETLIDNAEPFRPNIDHPADPDERLTRTSENGASTPGAGVIRVTAGLRHIAADAGLTALRTAGVGIYQRDRNLVRICLIKAKSSAGEVIEVPGIASVTAAMLGRHLGRAAGWEKFDRHGALVRIDPPSEVVDQILGMIGEWPFPPLAGVIGCPTLRPDGSLLAVDGYDAATGLVLRNGISIPPIPEYPTPEDSKQAAIIIESLLAEFPFVDAASRSVAMSKIITPVVRGSMPVAPMHIAKAPQPGTGKSFLADIASMVAIGERCAVIAVAPNSEETEKRLVGAALAGYPIIALDNCRELLQGDFLCQATERPLLQLRKLGSSDQIRVSNSFTVFANGNNVAVADDLVRRTITTNLDANVENPEKRIFKANPLAMVRAHRGHYVAACLIVCRGYITAGKPDRASPLESYEAWSDVVRSSLIWLGYADPVDTMDAARCADPVREDRAAVFAAWRDELQVAAAYLANEIVDLAEKRSDYDQSLVRPALHAALLAIATHRGNIGLIDARRLGIWLKKNENNILDGHKLVVDRSDSQRPRWSLIRVSM